ncbi:sulfurtransferase [bacterium (Candidatus Blackallbacteria) CG17_big_fil_post_rev_8_21_14_2_50_48_46]|uniref:Sulfurtransferase n=1 Tax=bacterium (Candidatus Blackallbacteria) CG17_big_fil_post_rev_8_21_14_2_50_48_46 TaxID=2014261 RepID=A0A2M7G7D5_9BACT|nr:MAG: sulfurtransferase [bacterium (Candidatus Blackallbacteria) CG18_big_fil_WC_8_21_14_2_50_49_26]PIW17861.1 MAG: sulfurtransferase [bacterium (Candidatus Blackallbacteria) CG17_big_fil_post_rev_8_21_14_2_50_48_46]PIW48537.1 MAG: sulfurtransferase [bacterium (Candidatus Blackallbacteria) CG13_big_fil_rev_8_21_14_2_50_49_14]
MSYLIQPATLLEILNSPEILIFDTRFALADPDQGQRAYATSHLPGALYLDLEKDLSSPVSEHGGRHPLPDQSALLETLLAKGLNQDSRVVIYDDAQNMVSGRLWWLLRWLGHEQVQVLDGGWQAWQALGYPVTTQVPEKKPGHFRPSSQPQLLASIEEVKTRSAQTLLVDARSSERYRGEQEPLDPRAGHIPGALNRPFADNLQAGNYKSTETLRQEFEALGLQPEQEIIVYCGSGVSANHTLIALEEAGYHKGRLYVGSWSDWCSYPENPVQTGPQA